ncbi:MAG: YceI family protein [Opitutaceae bacterium]|nr:YceI family protein [Opitutaceae bacterium]
MNNIVRLLTTVTAASAALALSALAAPLSFDFKDPKGVNNVQFSLDAPLEQITGHATGVSGTISFDPANPGATTGKIVVASSSLTVSNAMMKDHLHSAGWLDVAANPEIVFEAKSLKNVKTSGDTTTADVTGTLTLKGVSKEVTVPVTFTYLPGKLGARVQKMEGDLLVVRADFLVNRSDFDIKPGQMTDKVAEQIHLKLSIAGAAPKA